MHSLKGDAMSGLSRNSERLCAVVNAAGRLVRNTLAGEVMVVDWLWEQLTAHFATAQ